MTMEERELPSNLLDVVEFYTHIKDLDNNEIDNYGLLKDILEELDLDESYTDSILNFCEQNGYRIGNLNVNGKLSDYLIIAEKTSIDQIKNDFTDFYVDDTVEVELRESLEEKKNVLNEALGSMSQKMKDLVTECEEIVQKVNPDWNVLHPSQGGLDYLREFPLFIEISDRDASHRLGFASYPKNGVTTISLNSRLEQLSDEEIKNTILHELGHIIAYQQDFDNENVWYDYDRGVCRTDRAKKRKLSHHGPIWKNVVKDISDYTGIELSRLSNSEEWKEITKDDYKYFFKCPECGSKLRYNKRTKFTYEYDKFNSKGEPLWVCSKCKKNTGKMVQFVKIDKDEYLK